MPSKETEMRGKEGRLNLAVIATPFYSIPLELMLANFINLLEPTANKIYVITGKFRYQPKTSRKVHVINMRTSTTLGLTPKRILIFLLEQPGVAFNLLKLSKNLDAVIFAYGTRMHLLPLLTAKLLRKRVSMLVTGSESKGAKMLYSKRWLGLGRIYSTIVGVLERINFHLTDQITVESESITDYQGLNKFREKMAINGAMYIDTSLFTVKKGIKDRKNLVAYIGRLSQTKGVLNFVKAMPLILERRGNIEFLICGDGPMLDEIKDELKDNGLYNKVRLVKWIPHDELPNHFKEIKLLVLPSDNEGVPGIIQEAMACGVPALVTTVGGMPDLVKDEETGFILENNSPECIAKNVIRALEHPRLDEIAQNARRLIEQEYAYEVMVEKCKTALDKLMKGRKS